MLKLIERFIHLTSIIHLTHIIVCYKERTLHPLLGIPTGGKTSRQIADTFLHWLIFHNIRLTRWNFIKLWKRFIDDCTGTWLGTIRQFLNFVRVQLNVETNKFGINFFYPMEVLISCINYASFFFMQLHYFIFK